MFANTAPDATKASGVGVTLMRNGKILAICSKPDFDPNDYQNADSEIYNRNLPIWKSYEPGSTFKIIS